VGIAALDALQESELLHDEDLDLIETVAQSLVDETETQYDHDAEITEGEKAGRLSRQSQMLDRFDVMSCDLRAPETLASG